jgi:hypothetical protein
MHRMTKAPGERVIPGIYHVHHYQHRQSHLCALIGGSFPECNVCKTRVRFEPALTHKSGPVIWNDVDFRRETKRGD